MTSYYNLLENSLKNGYKQVITIYNMIDKAIEQNKVVNVCTGALNLREKGGFDNFKVFSNWKSNYLPIIYKSAYYGVVCNKSAQRILETYAKWLDSFDRHKDLNILREEVTTELKAAKEEYDQNKKKYYSGNNYSQFKKLMDSLPSHPGDEKHSRFSHMNCKEDVGAHESEYENDSFINDDEEDELVDDQLLSYSIDGEESNLEDEFELRHKLNERSTKKTSKKKISKNIDDEVINIEIEEESNPDFLKKKRLRKGRNSYQSCSDNEDNYEAKESKEENEKSPKRNQKLSKKLSIIDDEEEQQPTTEAFYDTSKNTELIININDLESLDGPDYNLTEINNGTIEKKNCKKKSRELENERFRKTDIRRYMTRSNK